jgi:hypothetical protein
MNRLRLILLGIVVWLLAQPPMRAQAPLPPFDLSLTLNDGVSQSVFRGWPLLFLGDAEWLEETAEPISLDRNSLALSISPVRGPATQWPLRRVTEFATEPMLGPASDAVRVVWVLTGEQTAALVPGKYTANFAWAGRTSPPLAFTVSDPPKTLPVHDEIRRSLLQSQMLQYFDDTAEALAVLGKAETRQPESIALLVQRARVHVQRKEYREAVQATQRALMIFDRDHPNASHPPESILEVEATAMTGLFKGITPGPRRLGPPAATKVVGVVSTPVSAPATQTPITPSITPTSIPIATSGNHPFWASEHSELVPAAELIDGKIIGDATGQWAVSATAGSQYGKTQYSAARATGAPSVSVAGNSPDAWCPEGKNTGTDWLEVSFEKPIHATEVRIRQNDTVGAIVKIEVFESDGTSHVWWEGTDAYKPSAVREIVWFAVRVPKTSYLVAKIKITLNLAAVPGWKQVDAVQLVGP